MSKHAGQELRRSDDAAGDSAELRRRMGADGYLYLPGLLDGGQVAAAADGVLGVMRGHGWIEDGTMAPRAPLPVIYGPEWRELYVAVHGLEELHRLGFDSGLRAALVRLMGRDIFVLPRRIVRLIGPACASGPGVGVPAHRDYESFGIPDMLITWIPLVACAPADGGLWVRNGSHRAGVARCRPFTPGAGGWQTASYKPGDVLVMHCYTAHASAPNHGDRFRLSIDFRWQRACHPVPLSMLDSDVNIDWAILAAGWRSDEWISVPDAITVFDDESQQQPAGDCPPSELFSLHWQRRLRGQLLPARARRGRKDPVLQSGLQRQRAAFLRADDPALARVNHGGVKGGTAPRPPAWPDESERLKPWRRVAGGVPVLGVRLVPALPPGGQDLPDGAGQQGQNERLAAEVRGL